MTGATPDRIVERLRAAGCVAAEAEGAALLAAASGSADLESRVRRRETGEPLAWITGTAPFAGRSVLVDPGVYVPRPQTETLAARAGAALPVAGRAVDLCTGTGAVAVHLRSARPAATVVGVDVDPRAVRCARRNGIAAVVGDLDAPLRPGVWDVVTAVAPYVPSGALRLLPRDVTDHEPAGALDGGADGLAVVRRVIAGARRLLRPGGSLLLELGGDQETPVRATLAGTGFATGTTWCDEDGDLRGIQAFAGG